MGGRARNGLIVIKGIDGLDGNGVTQFSYNASTGVWTVTLSDNSTYQTGDLRGANGKGIASASYNATNGILTLTYTDNSTFSTTDIRGSAGPNVVENNATGTNITGLLKGNGDKVITAVPGTDYIATNDSRLTDNRTPLDNSATYGKVAAALKQKNTVTASVDLSANGIGEITLSTNTAFSFSNFELNKTYLLKITANGYTPSWASAAKHVPVEGNATFGTSGVFYVSLTCIDATAGSEKLLTLIMKGV